MNNIYLLTNDVNETVKNIVWRASMMEKEKFPSLN